MNGLQTDLIRGTIRDLDDTIESLRAERDSLDERLVGVRQRRNLWSVTLRELAVDQKRSRSRKGENLRKIRDLFAGLPHGQEGLSMPQIVEQTGIPWSSVRNEMQRSGSPFFKRDNAWWMRSRVIR